MEAYYFIVKGLLGNLQTQAIANSPQLMDLLLKISERKSLIMEKSVIYPEPSPQLTKCSWYWKALYTHYQRRKLSPNVNYTDPSIYSGDLHARYIGKM